MIIESGMIVALGLLFTFYKLSWKKRIWCLSNPLCMDVGIFIAMNMIHWGTFSGVMVAATSSLICSGLISLGRKCYGYKLKNMYYPGIWTIDVKELK